MMSYFSRASSRWVGRQVGLPNGALRLVVEIRQTDGWRNPAQDFAYRLVLDDGATVEWSEVKLADEAERAEMLASIEVGDVLDMGNGWRLRVRSIDGKQYRGTRWSVTWPGSPHDCCYWADDVGRIVWRKS